MKFRLLLAISIFSFTSPMSYAAKSKLEVYGDIAQYGIPLTAGLITAIHMDGEGMMQLAEGAFWTATTTEILKVSVDAQRPNGGTQSFPSGHTSAASQGPLTYNFVMALSMAYLLMLPLRWWVTRVSKPTNTTGEMWRRAWH
ncbi:phosphatase PAP2 family protein [Vibrio mimicus]|uniref:hypothetical protein n=1 Tax=Vibrio mimicus TaxID=674 RepID=UPI001E42BCFC|nr:hypothetical protein [Vibrio mimicus]